jgi:hypothetical protein
MQEPLDLNTLHLSKSKSQEEKDSSKIIANQINNLANTRDLHYARPDFVFFNVKTSVQLKYL